MVGAALTSNPARGLHAAPWDELVSIQAFSRDSTAAVKNKRPGHVEPAAIAAA
jgi:hypothetical protein